MEDHKTRDPYHVVQLLGHKNLQSVLVYIHIVKAIFYAGNDEFHFAISENVEEARKLIEAGFDYVCTNDNRMLFRKRK